MRERIRKHNRHKWTYDGKLENDKLYLTSRVCDTCGVREWADGRKGAKTR